MNVTVKSADLARELNLLEKIVGRKPTIPVLSNVLIRAHEAGLMLAATDLEIGLIGACVADVQEPGAVTLPAKRLMDLVKAQTEHTVTFTKSDRHSVLMTSGKFKSKLQSLPAEEFPQLPVYDHSTAVQVPCGAMRNLISRVRFAVNEKDKRFFLNGAQMELTTGQMLFVATDGTRVPVATYKDGNITEQAPVLLPTKALDELLALLAESSEPTFDFARTEKHYFFDIEGRLMISRTIDGKFPSWPRIIPRNNEHVAQINRVELINVLKKLELIDEVVEFSATAQGLTPGLSLRSAAMDIGEGDEYVDADYTGPDITLRLKAASVLDFLNAASGTKITLALKDEKTAALFQDGEDYLSVVMGMVTK